MGECLYVDDFINGLDLVPRMQQRLRCTFAWLVAARIHSAGYICLATFG